MSPVINGPTDSWQKNLGGLPGDNPPVQVHPEVVEETRSVIALKPQNINHCIS